MTLQDLAVRSSFVVDKDGVPEEEWTELDHAAYHADMNRSHFLRAAVAHFIASGCP